MPRSYGKKYEIGPKINKMYVLLGKMNVLFEFSDNETQTVILLIS
jgi:hypothetical protein